MGAKTRISGGRCRASLIVAKEAGLVVVAVAVIQSAVVRAEAPSGPSGPEPSAALQISLVWNDGSRLLPRGFDGVREELRAVLRDSGIEVNLVRAGETEEPPPTGPRSAVNVTLLLSDSSSWRLPSQVNGITVVGQGRPSIFIFFPSVVSTLGHEWREGTTPSARETNERSRALGRVLAHEVIHVVDPEAPHTKRGLMSGTLGRSLLLGSRPEISKSTQKRIDAAIRDAAAKAPAWMAYSEPSDP